MTGEGGGVLGPDGKVMIGPDGKPLQNPSWAPPADKIDTNGTNRTLIKSSIKTKNTFQKYNPHIPNIDVISDALITLSLSTLILNSLCMDGARDVIDIWYMGITPYKH